MCEQCDADLTDGFGGVAIVYGLPEKAADNPGSMLLGPEITGLLVNQQVSGIGQHNIDDATLWCFN